MSSHAWELAWKEGRWYEVQPAFPEVVEFAEHLKQAGSRDVLDFGCGAGRHSLFLAKQGFNVVGFDISQTALRKLVTRSKNESLENLLVVNNEMTRLPLANESFDAVVSTNVLHHAVMAEIRRAITEVYRVLKHGAVGFLMTLSDHDYKNGTGKCIEPGTYVMTDGDEAGIIHHFFSEKELLACFGIFEDLSVSEELIPLENGSRGHFHLTFRKG